MTEEKKHKGWGQGEHGSVFVRGLALDAHIGIELDEMNRRQRLIIDIDLWLPQVATVARTGRFADAYDYRNIPLVCHEVVERRHYRLVETLAAQIVRDFFERSDARRVRIGIEKLGCVENARSAGIVLSLDRPEKR